MIIFFWLRLKAWEMETTDGAPVDENLIKYDPNSVLKLSGEEEKQVIEDMRGLSVQLAGDGKKVTLEDLWKDSNKGTLFCWIRHFS